MLERNFQTRSMYRSVRYRVSRQNSLRTADPSACNFRIKRNSCFDSTMAHTTNNNMTNPKSLNNSQQYKSLMKTNYIKSFNSMMQKASSLKINNDKNQAPFFNELKVTIPNFQQTQKQVQQSQYPVLEPINQPLHFVQSLLSKSKKQLQWQRKQVQQIKAGLKIAKQKTIKQLKGIKNYGEQQFQKIRSVLRKNQVSQQQRKLKTKRQLGQLNRCHRNNFQKFRNIDNNSSNMQICIFNSTPYNLRQAQEYQQTYI